jgi:hypothetical protein
LVAPSSFSRSFAVLVTHGAPAAIFEVRAYDE